MTIFDLDLEEEEYIEKLNDEIKNRYEEKRILAIEFAEYYFRQQFDNANDFENELPSTEQPFEQFIKEKYEN